MSDHAGSTPVLLGLAAAPLRRALPASAWAALECLVARSHEGPDGRVAELGVRDLAADLGVSKNTVLRALHALIAAGLLQAERTRAGDGTFRPARYRLYVPSDAVAPVPPRRPARRPGPTPLSAPASGPTQLSLLGT